jgi:microcompartment protein CcmL/EutN
MSNNSAAVIELSAIYKGYEVQDAILKGANVEKLIARTICSGKYFLMFRGDAANIQAAVDIAKTAGGFSVINAAAIQNLDPAVFPAIAGCTILEKRSPEKPGAILILETFSVVSAIKAADFAIKEANLDILRIHVAMAVGGKGFVVMTGDVASLEAAVKPALEYIKQDGMLGGYTIIQNPHEDVLKDLI